MSFWHEKSVSSSGPLTARVARNRVYGTTARGRYDVVSIAAMSINIAVVGSGAAVFTMVRAPLTTDWPKWARQ